MNAGELKHQISIQQSTVGHGSDYGGPTETWATIATIPASKAHKTSREFYAAQKISAEITDLFMIRFRYGVTAKMRLIHDGKTYDIVGAPDPDGRRREIHLFCKEIV